LRNFIIFHVILFKWAVAREIFATRSFRAVRSTDPESREEATPTGMDKRGFWIPGLAFGEPGMTVKKDRSPGMTKEEKPRAPARAGLPGRNDIGGYRKPASTHNSQVIPEARAAGYPGSRKCIEHSGKNWHGLWIPARVPRPEPGRPAGMTKEPGLPGTSKQSLPSVGSVDSVAILPASSFLLLNSEF